MTQDEYIKLARKRALGLIDTKKIDYYFCTYLAYVAMFTQAFIKKDIDVDDEDINHEIKTETNRVVKRFLKEERDLQLATILFTITNDTFNIEKALEWQAFRDATEVYSKYASDSEERKRYVIDAAMLDQEVLINLVKTIMMTDDGDAMLNRICRNYGLESKEINTIRKEIKQDFNSFVVVNIDDLITTYQKGVQHV